MMGQPGGSQDDLVHSFNPDDHVPQDHLLRGIDGVLTSVICASTLLPSTATPAAPPSVRI